MNSYLVRTLLIAAEGYNGVVLVRHNIIEPETPRLGKDGLVLRLL
jgi:hypothetical protein